MPLNIQTNVSSLEAQLNVSRNQKSLVSSFQKLSSGYRVNSAADDAAGLVISEGMKAQIRSFSVAERNAADGISMAQTAEGALSEIHNILGRMRELSMQASNGNLTSSDRDYISSEFVSLQSEIDRIQRSTKFNDVPLINSSRASSIVFQVGLNDDPNDQIQVSFNGLNLSGVTSPAVASVDGADPANALNSLASIDAAVARVSKARSSFGAAMNKLDAATNNIQTMRLNLSSANSRIRDVDVAEETSKMARNQVLAQAGTSILAQANQIPQSAMNLLNA